MENLIVVVNSSTPVERQGFMSDNNAQHFEQEELLHYSAHHNPPASKPVHSKRGQRGGEHVIVGCIRGGIMDAFWCQCGVCKDEAFGVKRIFYSNAIAIY